MPFGEALTSTRGVMKAKPEARRDRRSVSGDAMMRIHPPYWVVRRRDESGDRYYGEDFYSNGLRLYYEGRWSRKRSDARRFVYRDMAEYIADRTGGRVVKVVGQRRDD